MSVPQSICLPDTHGMSLVQISLPISQIDVFFFGKFYAFVDSGELQSLLQLSISRTYNL